MPKIKKPKKQSKPSKTEMENTQLEFHQVKQQKKLLDEREKELKSKLDTYMTETMEPNHKGHYMFSTKDEKGNPVHLQKQARKKVELDEEKAKEFLRKNNLSDYIREEKKIADEVTTDQIINVLEDYEPGFLDDVETVYHDDLKQLVSEEKISPKQLEAMCDISINYVLTFIKDKNLEEEDRPENSVKKEEPKKSKRKPKVKKRG